MVTFMISQSIKFALHSSAKALTHIVTIYRWLKPYFFLHLYNMYALFTINAI